MTSAPSWAFTPGSVHTLLGAPGKGQHLALSPCERTLYVAAHGGLLAHPLGADAGPPARCDGGWHHVVAAPDGRRVYAATLNDVSCFAARTLADQQLIHDLPPRGGGVVVGLGIMPDGSRLFVGRDCGGVCELRLPEAHPVRVLPRAPGAGSFLLCSMVLSPCGTRLAWAQGSSVSVWTVTAAEAAWSPVIGGAAHHVRGVAWGPRGNTLFVGRQASVCEWALQPDGRWAAARRAATNDFLHVLCASRAGVGVTGAHDVVVGGLAMLNAWHVGVAPGAPTHSNLSACCAPARPHAPPSCVSALALAREGERVFACLMPGAHDEADATQVVDVQMRPPRAWSRAAHARYPGGFRAGVRTLLLCLARTAAVRGLAWPAVERAAFAEAAAALLAAELYGQPFYGD